MEEVKCDYDCVDNVVIYAYNKKQAHDPRISLIPQIYKETIFA